MNTVLEKYFEFKKNRIIILLMCYVAIVVLFVMAEPHVYDYKKIILAFVAVVLLSFMKIEVSGVIYKRYVEVMFFIVAIASFLILELINFEALTFEVWRIVVNAVPFYIIAKLLHLFTKKLRVSVSITLILVMLYSLANYYVWIFRGKPILPWDISAITTAATVASTYEFFVTKHMVYSFMICILCFCSTFVVQCKNEKEMGVRYVLRQFVVILCVIVSYITCVYPRLQGNMWEIGAAYYSDGVLGGFLGHVRYCQVKRPTGYEAAKIEEKLENAEILKAANDISAQNIIIIMNESFSDFRTINSEVISNDYMPYIDSLAENTIKGNLAVPIFGGNTCDSEFEVLLSASTSFSTPTPYNTTLHKPTESLVTYLKDRDFYAEAFHPYLGANWNRTTVYNNIGFDKFIDQESMIDPQYVRWCIGDRADYAKVIEEYESYDGEKFFMFNVTMQNHGGYETEFDIFPNTVDLSGYGVYPQAETYLSLVKESDEAFKELIEYFSAIEEPTLICFFGDHYPSIETEFYSFLYGKDVSELTPNERQAMYVTPLIIWTNYDIDEKNIGTISSNFLALEILNAANIDIEGYYSVLNDVYKEYPVISTNGAYDKLGNWHDLNEIEKSEAVSWQKYLQYYRIYD